MSPQPSSAIRRSTTAAETNMSLDRPGLDELVPSRYAVKIGAIDVMVISDDGNAASGVNGHQRRPRCPGGLAGQHVSVAGGVRLGAERGRGAYWRPDHTHRQWARGGSPGLSAGREFGASTGGRRHRSRVVTDVVLTHMHFDHVGGLLVDGVKERLRPDLRIHVAAAEAKFWESPDFSRTAMGPILSDVARRAAKHFLNEYHGKLRPFEAEYEVATGVVVQRAGGHTPGHSVVRLASGGDRLTFGGDAVFPVSFDHPEWHNGFEHDPEEATRVRVRLLRELAANRESLVSTHMPFPSVGRVAVAGDLFRWVPTWWDY